MEISEYIESSYKSHAAFIDSSTYSRILDNIVVACVDLIVIHNDNVLLGKRSRHHQKDWWIMGGRMVAGETFTDSAKRIADHELGISNINADRFELKSAFSAAWEMRAFPPEQNGTHTLSVVLTLKIDDDEKNNLSTNDEYVAIQWRKVSEAAADESYHPALRGCLADLYR
jgi:ADP-ribose pyrophosphatase YjhB (NUDIX family)